MTELGKALDSSGDGGGRMPVSLDRVREIFRGLESGDEAAFSQHVADDVDWTVMGAQPLAGQSLSKKAFIAGTFAKLARVLPDGAQLRTERLAVRDDQAVVELRSCVTAENGMRFDNRYCWVVYFRGEVIVRVLAYLNAAAVTLNLETDI
jgi:ketosteroid isomerase-like protein